VRLAALRELLIARNADYWGPPGWSWTSRWSRPLRALLSPATWNWADKEMLRHWERIASGNAGNGRNWVLRKQSRRERLQPGSILMREWDGARQRVEVLDKRGSDYRVPVMAKATAERLP
jgi:hypothetical protein